MEKKRRYSLDIEAIKRDCEEKAAYWEIEWPKLLRQVKQEELKKELKKKLKNRNKASKLNG